MKKIIEYECPTCNALYYTLEEAQKCKNTHAVKLRETLICEKCGDGFRVWKCGGIVNTIDMLKTHQSRNCDRVAKK